AGASAIAGDFCGAAIEIGPQGLDLTYSGAPVTAGLAGGQFNLSVNGAPAPWPARIQLVDGASISVHTGSEGNYAYLRFTAQIDVPQILESRATNATVGLGGFEGRALRSGDRLNLVPLTDAGTDPAPPIDTSSDDSIRFIWGIHADLFPSAVREAFIASAFRVSARMDRMGVRLDDIAAVFAEGGNLGLVSDAAVPGDIQI